jgi:protein gp37
VAEKTIIGWTTHTWNLAWGCEKISPGCLHCYADTLSSRYGHDVWGKGKARRTFGAKHWDEPLKWNREAKAEGVRRRVFCSSMTDWCLDDPTIDRERAKLWGLIDRTPMLDWQLLTKRADRIASCLPSDWGECYPNVWLGVSVEDKKHGLPRIDHLRENKAWVRFLSVEPLIEDLGDLDLWGIDWVIIGGESGSGHRPMDHGWARAIRDQCVAQGVALFFKQSAAHRTEIGTALVEPDGSSNWWKQYPGDLSDPVPVDPPGTWHPSGQRRQGPHGLPASPPLVPGRT